MANGFTGLDKLERLFSTRKKSACSRHTADSAESNVYSSAPDPRAPLQVMDTPPGYFPQTPFIRPRANVMLPRDELTRCSPRSSISSGSPRFSKTSPVDDDLKDTMSDKRRQSAFSTTASFHIPSRTSSLLSRRHDRIPGALIQLHLPRETAFADEFTQSSSLFPGPRDLPRKAEKPNAPKGLLDALPIYPATQVETPPPSDQDEFNLPSPPQSVRKVSTALLQPTPEPSPDMIPARDSPLSEHKLSTEIKRETASAPPSRRATATSVALLDDDWRDSYVDQPREPVSPKSRVVFREPPVQDFHDLTVEDLAEVKMRYPSKPPSKRAPPPPILPPGALSLPLSPVSPMLRSPVHLSPVSPALASSQVAAWEAARIAKKYDFDVVYVATFWPSRMNHLHNPKSPIVAATSASSPVSSANSSFPNTLPASLLSSPTSDRPATAATRDSTPRNSLQGAHAPPELFAAPPPPAPVQDCCPGSGSLTRNAGPLCGSLLAGYGLETIVAPFRLSTSVHQKILRTEGWIEHRNSAARDDEFARGYARSFYTGSTLLASATAPYAAAQPPRRSSAPEPDLYDDPDMVSRRVSFAATRSAAPAVCVRDGDDHKREEEERSKDEVAEARKKINRGIVFVAYRRPRGPGGAVNSSKAELDALGQEAETLVDMILDFHGERRRWEAIQEARRTSK